MKKKNYETPHTQHVEVELEEGVMAGGSVFVEKEDSESLTIDNQTKGAEFNFGEGFGDNTWD